MKSLVVVAVSLLAAVPAVAQEYPRDGVYTPPAIRVVQPNFAKPLPAPPKPRRVPMLVPFLVSDRMTSEEVLAIAAEEYAHLAKVVAEYGPDPSFAAYEKTADAHFAEGTRRLGDEVKAALGSAAGESPEEAFRREVETLGREVAGALATGTIGPTPPTFEQQVDALAKEVGAVLSQGSIGSNAPRYSETRPVGPATPSTGTATGAAAGAGMARD